MREGGEHIVLYVIFIHRNILILVSELFTRNISETQKINKNANSYIYCQM